MADENKPDPSEVELGSETPSNLAKPHIINHVENPAFANTKAQAEEELAAKSAELTLAREHQNILETSKAMRDRKPIPAFDPRKKAKPLEDGTFDHTMLLNNSIYQKNRLDAIERGDLEPDEPFFQQQPTPETFDGQHKDLLTLENVQVVRHENEKPLQPIGSTVDASGRQFHGDGTVPVPPAKWTDRAETVEQPKLAEIKTAVVEKTTDVKPETIKSPWA